MDSQKVTLFVQVPEREAGVGWYRDVLGLAHSRADEFGDEFALNDTANLRLTAIPGYQPSPNPAAGWQVADIAVTIGDLRAKGVGFEVFEGMGQDADGVWTAPDGGTRLAWFKDCAGNLLMLSERH